MKTINIEGHRWKVKDLNGIEKGLLGLCDYEKRTLHIPREGDTLMELDTIVHETCHACFPFLDEDTVERGASEIAEMLWKLDWRKKEKE